MARAPKYIGAFKDAFMATKRPKDRNSDSNDFRETFTSSPATVEPPNQLGSGEADKHLDKTPKIDSANIQVDGSVRPNEGLPQACTADLSLLFALPEPTSTEIEDLSEADDGVGLAENIPKTSATGLPSSRPQPTLTLSEAENLGEVDDSVELGVSTSKTPTTDSPLPVPKPTLSRDETLNEIADSVGLGENTLKTSTTDSFPPLPESTSSEVWNVGDVLSPSTPGRSNPSKEPESGLDSKSEEAAEANWNNEAEGQPLESYSPSSRIREWCENISRIPQEELSQPETVLTQENQSSGELQSLSTNNDIKENPSYSGHSNGSSSHSSGKPNGKTPDEPQGQAGQNADELQEQSDDPPGARSERIRRLALTVVTSTQSGRKSRLMEWGSQWLRFFISNSDQAPSFARASSSPWAFSDHAQNFKAATGDQRRLIEAQLGRNLTDEEASHLYGILGGLKPTVQAQLDEHTRQLADLSEQLKALRRQNAELRATVKNLQTHFIPSPQNQECQPDAALEQEEEPRTPARPTGEEKNGKKKKKEEKAEREEDANPLLDPFLAVLALLMLFGTVTSAMVHSQRLAGGAYGPYVNGGYNGLGSVAVLDSWTSFWTMALAGAWLGASAVLHLGAGHGQEIAKWLLLLAEWWPF
ncbi:hypothetical protein MMYC01_205787 [Madurella mycetomatis]|uniref:Uncharacterized protein n=1 Tax=Madurella mycetomatis TaxID=100816 RepID=A0A175W367_9PEZI|nr:hypothetical protein MMYC01_205787 [Madurella mycetomatis]